MSFSTLVLVLRRRMSDFNWRVCPEVSTESVVLCTSLFFALACNTMFWRSAMSTASGSIGFVLSLLTLLVTVHALLLGLVVWRWSAKPLLTLLFVITAFATYYMNSYSVYLDADMLRNVFNTDHKESRELITSALILPLLFYAGVPIAVLWRLRFRQRPWSRALGLRMLFLLIVIVVGASGAMLSFQKLSALIRNDREVRHLATPINYIMALRKMLSNDSALKRAPKLPIGEDAVATPRVPSSRPRLLVIVVGETARAQNWGLNGYVRQTTPQLAQNDVINFPDMHSCGTNTEVSVPCMFSPYGRRNYDERKIRGHQSLLHVLERARISTLWRDNQSGCKGVCDGLELQQLDDAKDPTLCTSSGRCMDEILLKDFVSQVRSKSGDRVVVLHQLGSHGPSYFQRYPVAFRQFNPTCETPNLGSCSREQVVAAYDNSLLYTDHFLVRTIGMLRDMSDYDTAMIYLSDHGESLGEKGLYLHGMPYAIAPVEQTRVPMVIWFSKQFVQSRQIDLNCVHQRARQYADHDNLFSSVLGLMQVKTALYERPHDLFATCEK
ncbi:MAG: phosphoethanolamine transferase [Xylella fastidiosa subsp. multiplex]|uniref:phosphoethanolamine transferase n=1 Tax=Xylella fastidiosa TaxID=2371 RepID=UPI00057021D2|nr:phosphoethanolamine transferase [Xylella fastidiosa]